jgi:hypothetical protein
LWLERYSKSGHAAGRSEDRAMIIAKETEVQRITDRLSDICGEWYSKVKGTLVEPRREGRFPLCH